MNTLRRICFLLLLSPIVASLALGQSDTLSITKESATYHCQAEQFRVSKLILPVGLVAVGTFGVNNGWFHQVRNEVREDILRWHGKHTSIDDYLQYAPLVSNLALRFTGLPARHSFREQIATTATACAVMGVLGFGMKYTIHEHRPDGSSNDAFPSGHCARAFMGAELVRQEYGTWPGVAAYTIATGVACLRLYNDRHWLNDVIGGAGIGILSAQAAYWLLPIERRLLGWDKNSDTSLTVVPVTDGHNYSLALSLSF